MGTRIPLSRAEEESRSLRQRLEMSTAEIGLTVRHDELPRGARHLYGQ